MTCLGFSIGQLPYIINDGLDIGVLVTVAAVSYTHLERANEIKEWFLRFEQVLRSVYEDKTLRLDFNIETFQFTIIQNNREPFDFNSMSMGYAAVFDIIGDLIMRMEDVYKRQNLM